MSCYAIGDIQGCFEPFQQLLNRIAFNPGVDTLWLTGDLVNRGPASLEVLRWVYRHQHCVQCVLGNHDLHLLTLLAGFGKVRTGDTLSIILAAVDGPLLLDWLRCQPLMIYANGYAMVHAGLLPQWSIKQALCLAGEVEQELAGLNYRSLLVRLYGNQPTRWSDDLKGIERLRVIINAMTRIRFITRDGELDLVFKGERHQAPPHLIPWFEFPQRQSSGTAIVCGHWSSLGLYITDNVLAIDTGCLWGRELTALRLEDRALFCVRCPSLR